jgi:hypothetical protein
MYLLNTSTLKLQSFVEDIPDYVILSHTWHREGEVTFNDIDQPHAQYMPGYSKLSGCCRQASEDGFSWVWIDTCCIDKRSSAELSDAINSMWLYYWNAQICYVYLSDVLGPSEPYEQLDYAGFSRSRWFTRGWTLQELLAPAVVEFYGSNWSFIGTKGSLRKEISTQTRIAEIHLSQRDSIGAAMVATKLGWAAQRETTRTEDIAYCLLGILGIQMPLLYGEGKRAFLRLQLELLKRTNEHTIFAWARREHNSSLLAVSPASFTFGAQLFASLPLNASSHEMTNKGLRISLYCIPYPENPEFIVRKKKVVAVLNCTLDQYYDDDKPATRIGIVLEQMVKDLYQRVPNFDLIEVTEADAAHANYQTMYIQNDEKIQNDDRPAGQGMDLDSPRNIVTGQLQSPEGDDVRVHWLVVPGEEGKRTFTEFKDPVSWRAGHGFQLFDETNGGLVCSCKDRTFMVAIRQVDLWAHIPGPVGLDVFRDAPVLDESAVHRFVIDNGLSQSRLLCDKVEKSVGSDIVVSVIAKKKNCVLGNHGTGYWSIDLTIKDESKLPAMVEV